MFSSHQTNLSFHSAIVGEVFGKLELDFILKHESFDFFLLASTVEGEGISLNYLEVIILSL